VIKVVFAGENVVSCVVSVVRKLSLIGG